MNSQGTATHYGFIVDGSMVKEITAEELAKACRKCAVLTVTDYGSPCPCIGPVGDLSMIYYRNQRQMYMEKSPYRS